MKSRLLSLAHAAAILLVALLWTVPARAQTTIDSTTLSVAMTSTQTFVTVAAVTCTSCTFGASSVIYIDMEAMCVNGNYVSGAIGIPVTRGCLGTKAAPHAISNLGVNKVVFLGPQNRFHQGIGDSGDPPVGTCAPKTQWTFLPWINVNNGKEWICDSVDWRYIIPVNVNGTGPSR